MTAPQRREAFVVEKPEFRLALEPFEDYYFVHHDVYKWAPSVYKESREILDRLAAVATIKVFCPKGAPKRRRYAELYGFRYSHTMLSPHDGEEYLILERT